MSTLGKAAALGAATLLVLLTTGAGDAGVRPGTAEGAELVKTGWWWAGNETPLDETLLAPPKQSPPNVPKGALPVAAAGGEPEKFTALEFRPDAEPGGFAEKAVLVLRESTEPGANINPDGAQILACPVTESFWADGAAGSWKGRPAYDCDLAAAEGERHAKTGLWTFDLTAVASLWTAEGHTGSTGVALVEGVEPPESFQVAFDGPGAKGVGFAFAFAPPADDAPFPSPDVTTATSGGGAQASSGSALTGSPAISSGTGTSGPPAGTVDPAPLATSGEPAVAEAGQPARIYPASSRVAAPAWYSGIPTLGYVLLPLVLGLAYLLMLALGPDAQPAAGPAQRGVGRALERLRTAGAAITTRGKN